MTDWIEHNGGPQPVADDVWVCVDAMPDEMEEVGAGYVRLPKQVGSWKHVTGFFILNQHLIDAKQAEIDALQHEVMWLHNALEQTEDAVVYGYTLLDDMDAHIDAAHLEGIRLGLEAAKRAIEPLYDPQADDILQALNPDTIAKEADNAPR